jgi:hypothetical protein
MVTEANVPAARIWSVDLQELYERHLCRHSQFGNNVVHVLCLIGVYFGLYGIAYSLAPSLWTVVGIVGAYVLLLSLNVPIHVWFVTVVFLAGFSATLLAMPNIPVWWYPGITIVFYKLQSWSHKMFTKERDMTEFNKKYQKGLPLFILLSLYELPVLLKYLVFGRKDWCA